MRIVFATDIHGSEQCFRKFINSAAFYEADVLILGGDLTGKALSCIVRSKEGYLGTLFGRTEMLNSEMELSQFEKRVRFNGFYPYRCEPDELQRLEMDEEFRSKVFRDVMVRTMRSWIEWADQRLAGGDVPCMVIAGNDDDPAVDRAFSGTERLLLINLGRVPLGEWEVFGYPFSSRTPWNTTREKDEDEIAADLEQYCEPARGDMGRVILNVHVPPYDSGLDIAPELRDLKPRMIGGEVAMAPAGSKAVRAFIEKYQPVLGLHGHVHESRGVTRIGRTVCVNPGSRYNEGVLHAVLVDLSKDKVKSYQFVAG